MPLLLTGFSDYSINTGEVEISYSVGPDNGPTLLLLHGVTSRRDGFTMLLDTVTQDYRVITIDQRGHGYSGHTPGHYMTRDVWPNTPGIKQQQSYEKPVPGQS
jgi:pimeloyl-ACP methyl ester carboxylesterase